MLNIAEFPSIFTIYFLALYVASLIYLIYLLFIKVMLKIFKS